MHKLSTVGLSLLAVMVLVGAGCSSTTTTSTNTTPTTDSTTVTPEETTTETEAAVDTSAAVPVEETVTTPEETEQTVETTETTPVAEEEVVEETKALVETFDLTARQFEFDPSTITVQQGSTVVLNITAEDVPHGFSLPDFGVSETLTPGKTKTVEFVADKAGTFSFSCSVVCGSGHSTMKGTLVVE